FLQYQCVVPPAAAPEVIRELLERIAENRSGSFLAVLKQFGGIASPGMLSFPRPGVTLALDFANRGVATFALLDRLDDVVAAAGGAVYPAKDARTSGQRFRQSFPGWQRFREYLDPRFSSGFWRRV
ncbi:MAG: FAD-binding protein, partial [Rhodanobacteraceae bacterium]